MPEEDDDILTPGEVAEMFKVHGKTVARWADQNHLPVYVVTPGGHRRFRRGDVKRWFNSGERPRG